MKIYCPNCNSAAVYVVRHDSDWGSTNAMYRANAAESYPNEREEQDEYGDINFFTCTDCYHEWF